MRHLTHVSRPVTSALIGLLISSVSVSLLLGSSSGVSKNASGGSGSFVRIIVDGIPFTHTLTNGETGAQARDALVLLVDAHPDYIASATTVPPGPFDPDDTFMEVLTSASGEVINTTICETDANYQNSQVYFGSGRSHLVILKPTAVAGGGSFNIKLDMSVAADVDETIATSAGDVAGLITGITNALTGLGFTVVSNGPQLVISKAGDTVLAARIESTDTLFTHNCVGITNTQPPAPPIGMPTLQMTGVVALVTGLLLVGILMLRRKARV